MTGAIDAVVFDVGETLVDETRLWTSWADWLGVPRFTFHGVLGGLAERGSDHSLAFELVRPGLDVEAEVAARTAAGVEPTFEAIDLYPDAVPCLGALRAAGYRLGFVGNTSTATERLLRTLAGPGDLVASSERWGVAKPDPAFFTRVAAELELTPDRVAYVGDRLDNDILPALAAGMAAVHVRRGPWGILQASRSQVPLVASTVDSLMDLAAALAAIAP